jgi:multidrug resistance efflux pump
MKKQICLSVLALLPISAAAFLGSRERPNNLSEAANPGPQTSSSFPDARPGTSVWVQGVGYVEPRTEVHRLVFKTDGVIAKCLVEVGDAVKKGDLLMALDDREQQVAVAVAEREVEVARQERSRVLLGRDPFEIAAAEQKVRMMAERLRYLRREHDRNQQLLLGSAVSHADLAAGRNRMAEAEAGLKGAEAEYQHLINSVRGEDRNLAEAKVRLAQARLALSKQRLHDTTLRAPFDGKVLEILKREGEAARSTDGEAALVFADLRGLRIRAEIDERHARGIKVGQEALAFGRGLGKAVFPGRVLAVREIMGRKTVFARTAAERKDLDVLCVLIAMAEDFTAPAGLRVDVRIRAGE